MNAILSFDHYDVLETIYRFNPLDGNDHHEYSPKFDVRIKYENQEKTSALVIFSIEFGDEKLDKHPLYIKAKVVGFFSIEVDDEEITEETINMLYKKNALAILFPYLRSLITDLSSKGSEMPVMLPTINIAALIENENIIKESIHEEQE